MSATKITTMAQLRAALEQGGYVSKLAWSGGATYHPEGFRGYFLAPGEKNAAWPVDVSLVAFNALQNRGELRRLESSRGYRGGDYVLKTTGYTMIEAEAKVNDAQRVLDSANKVLAEAQAAQELAYNALLLAKAELSKLPVK